MQGNSPPAASELIAILPDLPLLNCVGSEAAGISRRAGRASTKADH
jgi:hypothetical protein